MSPSSVVLMVLVLTLVWGGLAALLVTALRKERRKFQSTKRDLAT